MKLSANTHATMIILLLISIVIETVAITILPYFIRSHVALLVILSLLFLITYFLLL